MSSKAPCIDVSLPGGNSAGLSSGFDIESGTMNRDRPFLSTERRERMRIRSGDGLALVGAYSIGTMLIVLMTDITALRILFGIPFMVFIPGYALLAALLPGNSQFKAVETIALALGLSLTVDILIGFALDEIWEISLSPIIISLALFVMVALIVAGYRRRAELGEISTSFPVDGLPRLSMSMILKPLNLLLIVALCGALGALVYAIVSPGEHERFTEFYILEAEGATEGYPTALAAGAVGTVLVGIENHEGQTVDYEVKVLVNGELAKNVSGIAVDHNQGWRREITFEHTGIRAATSLGEAILVSEIEPPGEVRDIPVVTNELFSVGDYVRIGALEIGRIVAIGENRFTLAEALRYDHPAGTPVERVQNVEFILAKTLMLDDSSGNETLFSLWTQEEQLRFQLINQSDEPADYRLVAMLKPEDNALGITQEVIGPVDVAAGQRWQHTIEAVPADAWTYGSELALYRDEDLVYTGKTFEFFQTVRLWVATTEDDQP